MEKKELLRIRRYLGKTQGQMAQLLGVSLKAIQSFEQGWRKVPAHIERQALFLLAMKTSPPKRPEPCWEMRTCSVETKRHCPAWEFRVGGLCWFINGTICNGKAQESWQNKMKMCRQCVMFQAVLSRLRVAPEELISKRGPNPRPAA